MVDIGQSARVFYTGRLSDGTVFDSNCGGEPLEFVVGNLTLLPGFENKVSEMVPGEIAMVSIPAAEAYGERDEKLVIDVPSENLPNVAGLSAGGHVAIGSQFGSMQAKVVSVDADVVRLDLNHELAGQDLTFEIELVEVVHSSAIEREEHGDGCGCGCHKLKESLSQ